MCVPQRVQRDVLDLVVPVLAQGGGERGLPYHVAKSIIVADATEPECQPTLLLL